MSSVENEQWLVAQEIAEYAANLRFADLPEVAVRRASHVLLDFLGISIGGRDTRLGRMVADYVVTVNAGSQATIIGDGRSSTVVGAAFANATLSCLLAMSETHRRGGHIASEVVPAALAMAEHLSLDGRKLVVAMAAGYDVFAAMQPMVREYQRKIGLDHKGQVGSLASAVAAGVALGLNPSKMKNALALSADLACGTEQYTFDAGLCDTEGLTAGFGARNGVEAAQMADFGFRGPPGALDGPYGYLNAYGGGAEWQSGILGSSSALAETGLKPHVGCRHVHAAADATQELLKKQCPSLAEIESVEVGTYQNAVKPRFRVNYEPDTVEAAMYSLPVVVSVVLARGSWYAEDAAAFNEPEIARVRSLVKVAVDPEIEANYPHTAGAVVRVTTKDGETYEGRVEHPKGEPENMMTRTEREHKLRNVASARLPEDQIDRIIQCVSGLVELRDVGELVHMTFPVQD